MNTHQYNALYTIDLFSTYSPEPNIALHNIMVESDSNIVESRRVR
jgi:hypothetical protein